MMYLLLLGTILGGGILLFAITLSAFGQIKRSAEKRGINTDYYPTAGKVASISAFALFLVCFLAFGIASLYVQSAGYGLTARESFLLYARATGAKADSYQEIDGGDVTFFITADHSGQESWLAYQKHGLFYSRSYGLPRYYYFCNESEDGSYAGIAASVAEVETEEGYFYFVGTYGENLMRKNNTESVVFNGRSVKLTDGLMFSSTERLNSFSLDGSQTLNRI